MLLLKVPWGVCQLGVLRNSEHQGLCNPNINYTVLYICLSWWQNPVKPGQYYTNLNILYFIIYNHSGHRQTPKKTPKHWCPITGLRLKPNLAWGWSRLTVLFHPPTDWWSKNPIPLGFLGEISFWGYSWILRAKQTQVIWPNEFFMSPSPRFPWNSPGISLLFTTIWGPKNSCEVALMV